MIKKSKLPKKIKNKKLKFLKELNINFNVQNGGCSSAGGCTHWS